MSRTAARVLIAIVALANAACFIVYQSKDWWDYWTDQNGYMMLGRALAETGRFTRYPQSPVYVPEVIRTPGYPAFVAAVQLLFGQGHLPVAIVQAVVCAAIALLAFELARLMADDTVAIAAGLATALYPTLAYFAALTMTDVLTTLLVTAGVYGWLRGVRDGGRWIALGGIAFAAAAITRPSFQYLPIALLIFAGLFAPRTGIAVRRGIAIIAVALAAVAPWVAHNVVFFHAVSLSPPAAGIGRNLWEGHWQIQFPGRVQATLTHLAETVWDRRQLDERVRDYAGSVTMPPGPMLQYVHEWQDMRSLWDAPKEPAPRAAARVLADAEYGRLALDEIRKDPIGHLRGRLSRGVGLLWLTEIPVRYSDINRLPSAAIRAIWLAQAGLLMLAGIGGAALWRRGHRAEAAAFAAFFIYVTAVHVVLYSEARYTLPAKPAILVLAVIGAQATALSVTGHRSQGRGRPAGRSTQALGNGGGWDNPAVPQRSHIERLQVPACQARCAP